MGKEEEKSRGKWVCQLSRHLLRVVHECTKTRAFWGLVGLKGEPLYERWVSHVVGSRSGRSYWIRKGVHNLAAFDFVHVCKSTRLERATSRGPSVPRGAPSHSRLRFIHVSISTIISSLPLSPFASLFLPVKCFFH